MKPITENQIEEYALNELQALGYSYLHGSMISLGRRLRYTADQVSAFR